MKQLDRVLSALRSWGVSFDLYRHEAAHTMEDCARFDSATPELAAASHCKNLFLCNRAKTRFYLLVLDGDKPFRSAEVSHAMGVSRLSFGSEERLFELLGCRSGAVSPMGLLFDGEGAVQLVCDEALLSKETLLFHPCDNTATVVLSSKDFFETFLPRTGHAPLFVQI